MIRDAFSRPSSSIWSRWPSVYEAELLTPVTLLQ